MYEIGGSQYGSTNNYLGEKGKDYLAWQDAGATFAGRINAHKFKHLIKPSDTVLDFGCGGGGLLYNLVCTRKIGVDVNPAAREVAAGRGVECYTHLKEVPDGIADVIVSDHALEHIPYPIEALRQLRAKLKPHGILSVCVPIDTWRRQKRYDPEDRNHHLHTWTPQLLGNTLNEAGYDVVTVCGRINAWPGNWTVAAYSRLPYWLFRLICYTYGAVTAKGWETLAVARSKASG
jgi:SAM-dependent methyltransferase